MKKMVLFDENSNFIDSIEFEANEFFKASEKIEEVEELPFNEFFNVIEYGVDIYKPYNDGEDFIIQNVNKLLVDSFEGSNLDLIGRLLSKSCPVLYKLNVLNIIKEVYETGETKQFRVEYYDDDVLLSLFDHSFIKYKENIFIFAKSVDDLELLVEQEENLFSKSIQGLFVIQNESIV